MTKEEAEFAKNFARFVNERNVIKIMDENDYDTLINSGKMFTRKLVSGKSDRLVKLLHQDSQK